MKEKTPLVSVIVPVFNGANYLSFALQSLVKQTYKNIEIIVVNDGSNDEGATEKIVREFLKDYRVHYLFQNNNGVSSALNYGISQSKGEYVCWLSHDDFYAPNKIEEQINFLLKQKNKKTCIAYSPFILVDEQGKKQKKIKRMIFHSRRKNYYKPSHFFKTNKIYYCSLMIPASYAKKHIFQTDLKYLQDSFSYFQMLEFGYELRFCRKGTSYYRLHNQQGSYTRTDELDNDAWRVHDYFLKYYKTTKDKKFINAYLNFCAWKSASFHVYSDLFDDLVSQNPAFKISLFKIARLSAKKRLATILYKIKKIFFER